MKKGQTIRNRTIIDLVPLFYSLAILDIEINVLTKSMIVPELLKDKRDIANLRKRGLVIVQIVDKEVISTYHESKGIKELLNQFLELNNGKWVLTKKDSWGIKTGKYILTRIYRKYNKFKEEEEDCCECCGRAYNY